MYSYKELELVNESLKTMHGKVLVCILFCINEKVAYRQSVDHLKHMKSGYRKTHKFYCHMQYNVINCL
jgi:hypothetical protein